MARRRFSKRSAYKRRGYSPVRRMRSYSRRKRVKKTSLFSLPVLAGVAAVWYFFIRKPAV